MFWLIETQEQFNRLVPEVSKEIFVYPVYRHPEIHPSIFAPLCLYVKDLKYDRDYIINFFHSQALPFDPVQVKEWLKTMEKVYTPDRKALHHFIHLPQSFDLNLNGIPDIKKTNMSINYFTQRFYDDVDLNNIIPIVKHLEFCREIYQAYSQAIKKYEPNPYHQDISDVFWFIERTGLKVNSAFERYFDLKRPFLSLYKDWVFTQYNLNTTTGRPSNTFNSLNFAALNKENGCRSVFVPRNDFFMEIDLTAYHPTLISRLVGYESPTGDIYEDFAKEFSMDRSEAKTLVFRQLYGNIYDQYKDFEFFRLTKDFIADIWKDFMADGKFEGFLSGQVFYAKDLENMNPQKLFNYLIQNLETANNVALLKEIFYIINNTTTKVVLYTYDAILLDVGKEDKGKVREIMQIFDKKGFKIKISYGTDYNNLSTL